MMYIAGRLTQTACFFTLILSVVGCGVEFNAPTIQSSRPANLAGTWVGTLEDFNSELYEIMVVFNSQGQISSFTTYDAEGNPTSTLTGSVKGLKGSDKFFSFSLSNLKDGGLVANATFSHVGILIDGFSAGVLQKTTPTNADADKNSAQVGFTLADISASKPIGKTWNGSIMQVVISGGVITNVIGKSSTVTIFNDGSFNGYDPINGNVQNTISGNLTDPGTGTVDNTLGRYTGAWEQVDAPFSTGPVVILISSDKTFLGSYACYSPTRTLSNCDFRLWQQ